MTAIQSFFANLPGRLRTAYARIRAHELSFLFLAFGIPFALTALMYFFKGSFPFGNGSVLVLDLNGQYVYFYEQMQDVFRGQGSVIYTWERALGGEFLGTLAYYVASPFLILTLLFPEGYILDAIFLIFLCKAGACGASMAFYIYRRFPAKDKMSVLIFSTLYATCAYEVVQMHNSMWIDALIWLPLLVYGIEQLVYRQKGVLFAAMIALSLLSNFYIGYMMCIFCVFYFFYAYFRTEQNNFYEERQHFLKSLGRMALYGAIGVAIAAPIILPTYYSLQFGKTDFTDPSWTLFQNYNFLELLGKLYPGSFDTVRPEGLPFLYGGTLTLLLLPFYFVCRRVSVREKICGGVAITFFIASFNLSTVDLIWHGFQFPNWLNHRYSFMLTFFLVLFAYRAFCEYKQIRYHHLLAVAAFEVLILLVIQQTSERFNDYAFVWGSLLCIGLLLIVLHIFWNHKSRKIANRVLCAFLAIECTFVGLLNLAMLDLDVGFTSRSNYMNFQERFTPIIEQIQAQDTSFYRMEKTAHRMKNDCMQFNLRGLSNSTSTLNASALTFLNRMGLTAVSNWSEYRGGNPATDSLLGLKYIISEQQRDERFYELISFDRENHLYAYRNRYALSVVCAVDPALHSLVWSRENSYDLIDDYYPSSFELLNAMIASMNGTAAKDLQCFYPISYKTNTSNCDKNNGFVGVYSISPYTEGGSCRIVFECTVETTDPLYFFAPIYEGYRREGTISVTRNGQEHYLDTKEFYTENSDRIISLGTFEIGDELCITITPTEGEMFFSSTEKFIYALDEDVFADAMISLQASQMQITDYTDTRLTGTISVPQGRNMLYTSIPYDENWHVYIDGQEVEIYKTAEALLAANITDGEHTIELKYIAKEFYAGLAISFVGLSSLVGMGFYESHRQKKRREKWAQSAIVYNAEP